MYRPYSYIKNERGVSLIPTLIVLFIGTIIGIASSTTSNFELKIAANDRLYKQNFFRADGTNQEASQLIENLKENAIEVLQTQDRDWLTRFDSTLPFGWYLDEGNWETDSSSTDVNAADGDIDDTKFMVVDQGGAPGAEISMGSPFMHAMSVYGRYDKDTPRGRVIIQTEYRVKF